MRALLSLLFAFQASPAMPLGKVISVAGLVSLEPDHVNLPEGAALSEGARVTVMANSKLRLRLANGAVAEVGPDSDLTLTRGTNGSPVLRLPHGSLLAVARNPAFLEIRSGQIRLHLDGRAFYFEQRLDQSAYLCVCDGKAKANWDIGKTEVSGREHHHGVFLRADHGNAELGPAKPRGHDDAQLSELRTWLL